MNVSKGQCPREQEHISVSNTFILTNLLTDRNFVDNFLQVVIYLALVANI